MDASLHRPPAIAAMSAEDVIRHLALSPHPEGGHFREIHRDETETGERGALTSIYFLLRAQERSSWHRVDATEIWHFHGGAPLVLSLSPDGKDISARRLGLDIAAGEHPQAVVPPHWWQSAQSLGAWTLVGCTVAPAFTFDGFEIAPAGLFPAPQPR